MTHGRHSSQRHSSAIRTPDTGPVYLYDVLIGIDPERRLNAVATQLAAPARCRAGAIRKASNIEWNVGIITFLPC